MYQAELKVKDAQIHHLQKSVQELTAKLERFEHVFNMLPGMLNPQTELHRHDHHVHRHTHKNEHRSSITKGYTNNFDDSDEFYSLDGYSSDQEGMCSILSYITIYRCL